MNDEIIKQTLIESFEVLKDSWETRKEAIIFCIAETENYDGEIAMSMWQYILSRNQNIISSKEGAKGLVTEVLKRFCKKHYNYYCQFSGREDIRTMLDHIIPHFVRNEELIKLIFEKSYNAGYESSDIYFEKISCLIACMFLYGYPPAVHTFFKAIANNRNMNSVNIGMVLRDTFNFIEEVSSNSELREMYSITPEIKDVLINCLFLIKDAGERADCTITIMSL